MKCTWVHICIYTNIFTFISIVTLFIRNENLEQYKCPSLANGKNTENENVICCNMGKCHKQCL